MGFHDSYSTWLELLFSIFEYVASTPIPPFYGNNLCLVRISHATLLKDVQGGYSNIDIVGRNLSLSDPVLMKGQKILISSMSFCHPSLPMAQVEISEILKIRICIFHGRRVACFKLCWELHFLRRDFVLPMKSYIVLSYHPMKEFRDWNDQFLFCFG